MESDRCILANARPQIITDSFLIFIFRFEKDPSADVTATIIVKSVLQAAALEYISAKSSQNINFSLFRVNKSHWITFLKTVKSS